MSRPQAYERARELTTLGQKIFFDPALSASGRQSCASCHDPKFAYGPPNGLAVQTGGPGMQQPGLRAVPSLRYLQAVPQFTEHYFDSEANGDDSIDNGPTGGLTWDGRVDRGREQARVPLLSEFEMANASPAAIVTKALRREYAQQLRKLSRGDIFATIVEALEAFEQDPREFYPYSSRYDEWLAGKGQLTPREKHGFDLFTDPEKGNCALCHPAARGMNGTAPQFTDYGYAALGVPRNREIPANANPAWVDLGLCGPERKDLRDHPEYCGKFRTPTLRNVALRGAFFHNGVVHTLREAVAFYTKRDDAAADLPEKYRGNLETGLPFGKKPGLSDAEIDDIVAFLQTLTDQ